MKKKFNKILSFISLFFFSANLFAADHLTVLLDWFMNPDHAPLFVAQELGFFKRHQLEVELIGPADPSDPPKLIAAGKADIAITYQPEFLEQVDQGIPLKMIGTLINRPLTTLVALQSSSINHLEDLKGKRIGFSGSGKNNIILKIMLEKVGVALNDVSIINIHYNLTQALLSGKVDAVSGMMRNFELTQIELAGFKPRAFYPEVYGLPTYNELVFIAKLTSQIDTRYERFLIALEEANLYLQKHPEEMWIRFSKIHPELNNTLNYRAWFSTLPYFTSNPHKINSTEFMKFAIFMQKNNLIKTIQPLNRYIFIKE